MRHTHDTTFSGTILDFYKILEESEQFFILFLKKMENLRRFFSIFEVRSGNLNKKLHSGKSGARESKELKLKLVWPVLSASFLKSDTGKNYKTSKNFTKQFFFIQTRQISLCFDLFNAHAL
jgi:hypothetical protein